VLNKTYQYDATGNVTQISNQRALPSASPKPSSSWPTGIPVKMIFFDEKF
jgi:hypothetical protein